jgi:hypothetical protein
MPAWEALMMDELFHSLNMSFLILIFLIFLSFFFLIRGVLLYLANPERAHQKRLKKRLKAMEGLESSLNVNSLLKKASLEKSFVDQVLLQFSLFSRIQRMMFQANLKWKTTNFLIVAGLSGLVLAGMGLAKWGVWGGWPAVRWVWSSPTRFWPGERSGG